MTSRRSCARWRGADIRGYLGRVGHLTPDETEVLSVSDAEWPGDDEDRILDEMLRDENSPEWDACYAKVVEIVGRVGRRHHLPDKDIEDIVADVHNVVRLSLRTFRRECTFPTWITRIASNQCSDRVRRIIHDKRLVSLDDLQPDTWGHPAMNVADHDPYTPERVCIAHERIEQVLRWCRLWVKTRRHPKRDHTIIALLLEGLATGEIAEKLGLPPQTVANVIFALRQYLRERLLNDWLGDDWPWV
jgi:RNA polymerase sigma factor (sigma-70 family)